MEDLGISMFNTIYTGKKVLITGNTGFKGSWLSVWLLKLNAEVYGISKDIPTNPSMFEALGLEKKIKHHYADINDTEKIKQLISEIKPDFLFHLAAQPIVRLSYTEPVNTILTNVVGTANVLEALRVSNHSCTAVIISSDKCYENVEWDYGFRETDHLGGKDPYSASKGACEIIIHTYYHSFFKNPDSNVRIASARSGNVIGGGDWAENRLIPDCLKAWLLNESVEIRYPNSVRPWQHVLEPLSGYLLLGAILNKDINKNGEPYNFGPATDQAHTVLEMINELGKCGITTNVRANQKNNYYEAGFLKLNCDKALAQLKWKHTLEFKTTTKLTAQWYKAFYENKTDMYELTNSQIEEYVGFAKVKGLQWSHNS